jgi:hypothetical protein
LPGTVNADDAERVAACVRSFLLTSDLPGGGDLMPAPFPISKSLRVGEAFETLTAGAYDLTARPNKPRRCARRVTVLVAGNITLLKDAGGVDSPPGAVYQGLVIDADVSSITTTGGAVVLVAW